MGRMALSMAAWVVPLRRLTEFSVKMGSTAHIVGIVGQAPRYGVDKS